MEWLIDICRNLKKQYHSVEAAVHRSVDTFNYDHWQILRCADLTFS